MKPIIVALLFVAACGAPEDFGALEEAYTKQCPTNTVEGVDVYQGDGTIDWTKVQGSGRVFAFIKASQGNYNKQSTFNANWTNTVAAGMLRGAYHYFDATVDGVAQAQWFLDQVAAAGGMQNGDLPPVLDLECPTSPTQNDSGNFCLGNGKNGWAPTATLIQRVWDWLDTVEAATGMVPIIYTYPSWTGSFGFTDPRLTRYPLWIASPTTCANVPAPWTAATFWQYSSKTQVPGIGGGTANVDVDRFMGTDAQLGDFIVGDTHMDGGSPADGGSMDAGAPPDMAKRRAIDPDRARQLFGDDLGPDMAKRGGDDVHGGCDYGGGSDGNGLWMVMLLVALVIPKGRRFS